MATLPLLPDARSKLVGIARLAAEGESLRQGYDVEYFTLPVRSLLNRCTSARMPFTWTINPYRGCEFACKYCYARYTHEFMEMRDGADFEQKIFIKQHAAELLRQELRHVKPGEEIAIGTATDPYQPAERHCEVTRAILEEFSRHQGFQIGIVTKSHLVVRDIDLLRAVAAHNRVFVNLTITTLNADLARIPAAGAASRLAPGSDAKTQRSRCAGGCDLCSRAARHHRFAPRSGSARPRRC
jgi:DNA repair photolyase